MAKIVYNSKTYELNKKTLEMAKIQEEMFNADSMVVQYEKQFDFLSMVFPTDAIKEMFGTDDLNEIDLDELTLVCNMVNDAYKEKIYDQQRKQAEKIAKNMAIDKIIETGKSVNSINQLAEVAKASKMKN